MDLGYEKIKKKVKRLILISIFAIQVHEKSVELSKDRNYMCIFGLHIAALMGTIMIATHGKKFQL